MRKLRAASHRDWTETRPLLRTDCCINFSSARLRHSAMIPTISRILPDLGGRIVAEAEQAKGRTEGAGQRRCDRILPRFETLHIQCRDRVPLSKPAISGSKVADLRGLLSRSSLTECDWMEGHRSPKSS